ncbi:uncharacterized protein PG986_011373 [Apiospora aurea]|uniref:Ankyrin n=1 Tax=Apiospora aurea TaxID=335848 RepID=A0ABR1Q4Y0_9PEZI
MCAVNFLVVLDGLDECAEDLGSLEARHEILRFITKVASNGSRILVASRDLADIRAELGGCSSKLQVRAPDPDMRDYVRGRLHGIEKRIARAQSFKETIISKVVDDADGIFLLARLMLDILAPSKIINIRQIKKFLQEPQCDLTTMYQETLARIMSNNRASVDLARKTLLWLCYSHRPLHESEIQHTLATEIGDDDFDVDGITPGELLQACCMGIVVSDCEGIYSLFHQTSYDFFRSSPELGSDAAHWLISKTCLCYLSFSTMKDQSPCQSLETLEKRRETLSLLDYAAKHWADHARQVENDIVDSIVCFINDDVLRQCLTQAFYHRERDDKELQQMMFDSLPTGSTALQVACRSGLPVTAKRLLAGDEYAKSVAQADDQGWTPLIIASSYGHLDLVDLLLTHTTTTGVVNEDNESEGSEAGSTGEKDVVGLNKADEAGWTPLFWAVVKGNVAAAEKLLAAGASTSLQDRSSWTPIDWAAFRADRPLATLLLQYTSLRRPCCTESLRPPREFSAIFLAAAAGDNQTVESLLQHGATAPISAAVIATNILPRFLSKEQMTVKMDYESGGPKVYYAIAVPSVVIDTSFSQIICVGHPVRSASYRQNARRARFATWRGFVSTSSLEGADTTLQDGDGHTPLDLAITVAAIPCIKMFLECLDPRAKGLSRLIECGNAPAAFLYGWDRAINSRKFSRSKSENMMWSRPDPRVRQDSLHMLEASRPFTAVDSLACNLSRDNVIDSTTEQDGDDVDDDSAIEILRVLLDRGCDVNAVGPSDYRPLHVACRLSNPKLVSFLVDNGADVNVSAPNGDTYLIIACHANIVSLDVLRVLLKAGADINANKGSSYQGRHSAFPSALLEACRNAPAEVVRFLIASGAHVNTYDCLARHPLHIVCGRSLRDPATRDGTVELIEHVLGLSDPDILSSKCYRDHEAISWGESFRRLVSEFGADPVALVDNNPIIIYSLRQYSWKRRAASDGFENDLVALLEAGADINAVDEYKETALNVATSMEMDLEFMRILLQHGAEPGICPN